MVPTEFSSKQRAVLGWWCDTSPHRAYDGIICDGAVRSGKTLCLGLSFFCWAMARFDGAQFALCGRSIAGVRRNLLSELLPLLRRLGFRCVEQISQHRLIVRFGGRENIFYLFGGRDESSAAGIQGMSLAGVLLDEAALMPRSFVEQACARCSLPGAKLWFSCNPEGPGHWFYRDWILQSQEKRLLHFHFTMRDNPGLRPAVRARFERLFQGVFYQRFVLGEWVAAEGLVYDFFHSLTLSDPPPGPFTQWKVACDYGTVNPTCFGLWGEQSGVWYRVDEYYYDSRVEGRQKTDGEYAADLRRFVGSRPVSCVIVDPSAASFIEVLRREGWQVVKADNDVAKGIRVTAELLRNRQIVICRTCVHAIEEFGRYRWDEKDGGRDKVRKEHDHAMDEIRYFAMSLPRRQTGEGFFACAAERQAF